MRRALRIAGRVGGGLVLVTLLAAAVLLLLPLATGHPSRLVIVSGHSMEPTFHTGDVVIALPATTYRRGEVTPYRVPKGEPGEGGLVIHRIVGGDAANGFVMQGDNNPTPDIWTPRPADMVGRQVLLVPRLGLVLAWARQPAVLAALVAGLVTTMLLLPGKGSGTPDAAEDAADDEPVIDLRDRPTDGGVPPAAVPEEVAAGAGRVDGTR